MNISDIQSGYDIPLASSEDALFYFYALRLTPYPNTEHNVRLWRETIPDFMDNIRAQDYIYGQEYERNYHFHVVFYTHYPIKEQKDNFEEFIETHLYPFFSVLPEKKGNPTFSLQPVRSLDKALPYAVKDGDFIASPNWTELSLDVYANSHQKHHSVSRSIKDLTQRYKDKELSEKQLFCELCYIRAELGLGLKIQDIDAMVLSIKVACDRTIPEKIYEDRIIKENLRK